VRGKAGASGLAGQVKKRFRLSLDRPRIYWLSSAESGEEGISTVTEKIEVFTSELGAGYSGPNVAVLLILGGFAGSCCRCVLGGG